MSKQVVTVIVEDKAIVDKLQSSQTTVEKIVVGASTSEVIVPAGWTSSESVTVGDGNHFIGEVVNNPTIVEKVVVGTPIRIGDTTILTPGLDSADVIALIGETGQLVWQTEGDDDEFRVNIAFKEDGETYNVRTASFNADNLLQLELAQFTPTVSATGQNLNWDQPATQWSVSVTNPDDITTQFLDSVQPTLTDIVGTIQADVSLYTTSGPTPTPGPGVDWTQTFFTNGSAIIASDGAGRTGGASTATVSFNDNNDTVWTETSPLIFNWNNADVTISFGNLNNTQFLGTYATVPYTVTLIGIEEVSNTSTTVTTVGGTVSNLSGSGTFTFTTPIHKDNNDGSREVTATVDFTRPSTVTGTEYTVQDAVTDTTISVDFTFPSFWIFTAGTAFPPSRDDIVNGNQYDATVVNTLGDEAKNFSAFVDNPLGDPQTFWIGLRSTAAQPSAFQTGSSAALVSDVSFVTSSVNLEPDAPPAGYIAEPYSLYGIVLQPGQTYVEIS